MAMQCPHLTGGLLVVPGVGPCGASLVKALGVLQVVGPACGSVQPHRAKAHLVMVVTGSVHTNKTVHSSNNK
jgi:hypothetical protein